jgi:hypothetical protein
MSYQLQTNEKLPHLSDYLGDANDLAELLKVIENQPKIINDDNREIVSSINNKQISLQKQALQQENLFMLNRQTPSYLA